MLLPHNGKAFGAMREMYGMLHERKSSRAGRKGEAKYDDDDNVRGGTGDHGKPLDFSSRSAVLISRVACSFIRRACGAAVSRPPF